MTIIRYDKLLYGEYSQYICIIKLENSSLIEYLELPISVPVTLRVG